MNLLFITADQWRWDAFGLAAPGLAHTPNIDAVAREGLWFERHYVQAAPCGPSRASIHTGVDPRRHGAWRNGMPVHDVRENWAARLEAAGLPVHLVGYTHTADPYVAGDSRAARAFEGILPGVTVEAEYRIDQGDWAAWLTERDRPRPPEAHRLLRPTPSSERTCGDYAWGTAAYPFCDSDTAYMAERACAFMARQNRRPWALHVTFFRPHDPYVVASDMPLPSLDPGTFRRRGPPLHAALAAHPYLAAQLRGARTAPPMDDDVLIDLRRHYLASASEMDAGVGLLMSQLANLGLEDSTLVIITSDHGDQLGDHWLMNKLGPYDQSFHVPLIVRDPRPEADGARGTRIAGFTQATDLAPTLVDYAHAAPLRRSSGRSLRPLIEGNPAALPRDHAVWFYDYAEAMPDDGGRHRLAAVRSRQFLYAEFDDFEPLLIDVERDGEDQWRNRAAEGPYAASVAHLRSCLTRA